jgi:hypothetical protein
LSEYVVWHDSRPDQLFDGPAVFSRDGFYCRGFSGPWPSDEQGGNVGIYEGTQQIYLFRHDETPLIAVPSLVQVEKSIRHGTKKLMASSRKIHPSGMG